MIAAAHQTMMGPQGAPLPYDAEVEYLEINGDGTYIDTGAVPANNPSAQIVAQCLGTSQSSAQTTPLFGLRNYNVSPYVYFAFWVRSDTLKLAVNYAATDTGWQNQTTDKAAFHTFALDNSGGYYDGVKFVSFSLSIGTNAGGSVYVGAVNQPNNSDPHPSRGVKMRVRSFDLYNGGTLAFSGKSVRLGSTGYLYDAVSGNLVGAASGTLIVGPDVT